jgi:hypothetical protein
LFVAKFKTVMNADKFKKAINGLPASPGEGVEFLGFRATKDGEKDNVYIGLYVGADMTPAFTKEKAAFKSPTLFKGVIHRSPKQPMKKLVLESSGQKSLIKELGKESLKANKLKYAIVAVETGEAEPDLSAQELAEMGLTDADMLDGAPTANQPKVQQTATQTPPRPTTPPRPVQQPPQQQPPQQQAPQKPTPDRPTMPSPGAQRSPRGQKLMARARMVGGKVQEITGFDKTKAAPLAHDLKTVLTNLNGPDTQATHDTVETQLNTLDGPKLWKAHAEARVGNRRAALHNSMINRFDIVEKTTFVRGEADRVNAKINPGDQDKVFATLTKQLAECETNRDAKSLSRLEGLCQAYLQGQQGLPSLTPEDKVRMKFVQSQLAHARLAQQAIKYKALGDPSTWDGGKESQANEMQAVYFFEEGSLHAKEGEYGADPLGGDAGVNGSWWIRRVDPGDKEGKGGRKFIFKPTDAEDASVAGVQPGSLASREALAKVFNDELFASAGFDAGVCPTVLAEIDSSKLPDPGGKCSKHPTRLGSMQQLADPVIGDAKALFLKNDLAPFQKTTKENLEQVGIFDLMTGALDRHAGNVMLANGPNDTTQVVPIDHGLTMPGKDALMYNRRRIAGNALVTDVVDPNGHTQQPLSPAMKQGILQIKPAEMIKKIKDARQQMAQRHGGMKDDMGDENFAIMQRNIEFLQAACAKDFSLHELFQIMAKYMPDIQDAAPDELPSLVNRIEKEVQQAKKAREELKDLCPNGNVDNALMELGWWLEPGGFSTKVWVDENPAEVAKILKTKKVNPGMKAANDEMIRKLGGKDAAQALMKFYSIENDPPARLYGGLKEAMEKAAARPDPAAGKKADQLQAEFQKLGGDKAWAELLTAYPKIKVETDPDKLLAQKVRNLTNATQMKALDAKFKQVDADPAWAGYIKWVGEKPAKPDESKFVPNDIIAWMLLTIEMLDQWKEFEKEGGIPEFNRLGGAFNADAKMDLTLMLAQLRFAKAQAKSLKDAIETDDTQVTRAQTQFIQQDLRDAQPHYAQLPRVAAVQAFTQRAQTISNDLGGPTPDFTKLQAAATKLKQDAEVAVPIYATWDKKLGVMKQAVSLITSKKHPRATDMTTALNDGTLAFDQGEAEKGKSACEKLDKLVHEATGPKK